MAIPKLNYPTFELEVPSSKQKVRFRPFLVKEEKLLLMAKESNEQMDIINVLKQVIVNCDVEDKIDVNNLATFDLEYLFLKLRSKSVNEVINVSYVDPDDEETYSFEISVDDIKMNQDPDHSNIVKIGETNGIVMKYPNANLMSKVTSDSEISDLLFFMIRGCMDSYYDGDEIIDFSDCSEAELNEFIENLPTTTLKGFEKFFDTMPKLYHKLTYTNKNGEEKTIELRSIEDFFM